MGDDAASVAASKHFGKYGATAALGDLPVYNQVGQSVCGQFGPLPNDR